MFTMEHRLGIRDVGEDGRLSIGGASDLMMDASCFQQDSEPGFRALRATGTFAIFLVWWQIDFVRRPNYGEMLKIETRVFDCKSVFEYRNTVIYDAQGGLCVLGCSAGAFVDKRSGRPTKLDATTQATLTIDEKVDMEYLSRKVAVPEGDFEQLDGFRVPKYFIDSNKHMNSSKYILLAESLIDRDFCYKRVRVEYKTPAVLDEILEPQLFRQDQSQSICLMHKTSHTASAVIEFTS